MIALNFRIYKYLVLSIFFCVLGSKLCASTLSEGNSFYSVHYYSCSLNRIIYLINDTIVPEQSGGNVEKINLNKLSDSGRGVQWNDSIAHVEDSLKKKRKGGTESGSIWRH